MKFTKKQKTIIGKIASGEITDIPSYIRVFNLSMFIKLSKEDIEKRMEIEENGKTYKHLKEGVNTIGTSTSTNNPLGFSMPRFYPIIPKEEDYEDVLAKISYHGSTMTIEADENNKFKYDFFEGMNITNSFSDIKDFLTIWQFLKTEGLVLEVGKKVTKADYEPFFEYKPILETKYGKEKENTKRKLDENIIIKEDKGLRKVESSFDFLKVNLDCIVDYRKYIDYYFEYNKANELICSQFINKQIYGNSELDIFIKKRFKTNEMVNLNKTLIPAYMALVLTLGITIWQNSTDNSEITAIKSQLTEIQEILKDNPSPNLEEIENKLQQILDSPNINSINKQLEDISKEIKEQ